MKSNRKIAVSAVVCLFLAIAASAQTTPTPKDPLETGYQVSVNAGVGTVSNAPTNNGYFFSSGFRVSQHMNVRADLYLLNNPALTISLLGPEYRISAQHLFKNSSYTTVNNLEFFVNGSAGASRFTDTTNATRAKFAFGFGGGFDYKLSDTVWIRPLDIKYVNYGIPGTAQRSGQILGNHLQFAASIGLRL